MISIKSSLWTLVSIHKHLTFLMTKSPYSKFCSNNNWTQFSEPLELAQYNAFHPLTSLILQLPPLSSSSFTQLQVKQLNNGRESKIDKNTHSKWSPAQASIRGVTCPFLYTLGSMPQSINTLTQPTTTTVVSILPKQQLAFHQNNIILANIITLVACITGSCLEE